jgi:transposase
MTNPLPIPDELWSKVPADAQAAIAAVSLAMQQRINDLETRVRELEARLNLNSTNSSKPPSTDPIGFKRTPPRPPGRRHRGGQKGHARAVRPLVPPEKVAQTVVCKPPTCRRCGHALGGNDPTPRAHQVAEFPPIEPMVIEYQLHRLACPNCRTVTCAALPEGVPSGCFGPRLQATLCLLAGGYRLSKRQVRSIVGDLSGLSVSTGMVCKLERTTADTLAGPVAELAEHVHQAPAVNIDETGWREGRKRAWLWVVLTPLVTVFAVARSRAATVAKGLLGPHSGQVVTSDRFSAYEWIDPAARQVCWAHLRRDFQAMIDRGGEAESVGCRLLKSSDKLFAAWHRVRDGTADRSRFAATAGRLRGEVRTALEEGSRSPCAKTAATCWEVLKVEPGLWTFARMPGVEPTNNAAERSLRHAVIWRRVSGGSDSESGGRFVARVLSVVATCRQQRRDVLGYLTSCFEARLSGHRIPSLLPEKTPEISAA